MKIQHKLILTLCVSLIIVVAAAFAIQQVIVAKTMSALVTRNAANTREVSGQTQAQIYDLAAKNQERLNAYEIESAQNLFELINANLSKDIRMGNKRGLLVRLRRTIAWISNSADTFREPLSAISFAARLTSAIVMIIRNLSV